MPRGSRLAGPRKVHAGFVAAAGSVLALVLVLVSGAGTGGCQSPTQVTVELRTFGALPCSALKGVSITVAQTPAEAEARMKLQSFSAQVPRGECGPDGRTVGTLVLTPSGQAGAIVVRARLSDDPGATCEPPEYKGCIVARRSFSFIDHASLTLPITLEAACADVPCDVESSCRSGVCVSSKAGCSETLGSCPSVAEPVPAPDGGSTPPPVGEIVDAGPDAPPVAEVDASSDASLDASPEPSTDASVDGNLTDATLDGGAQGGLCPTNSGPVDCFLTGSAPVCCFVPFGSFSCTAAGGCAPSNPHYNCTGPLHCGGNPCCAGGTSDAGADAGDAGLGFTASCAGGGPSCLGLGKDTVCSSNGDCPIDKPVCKKILHSVNGHTIYACDL